MGITPMPYDENKGYHESLILTKSLGDWSSELNRKAKDNALHNATFFFNCDKFPLHKSVSYYLYTFCINLTFRMVNVSCKIKIYMELLLFLFV